MKQISSDVMNPNPKHKLTVVDSNTLRLQGFYTFSVRKKQLCTVIISQKSSGFLWLFSRLLCSFSIIYLPQVAQFCDIR